MLCKERITENKIVKYPELVNKIVFKREFVLDTTNKSLDETVKEVIKKLETIGFYDSSAVNILPKTFNPIEDKK